MTWLDDQNMVVGFVAALGIGFVIIFVIGCLAALL